tara:strand:+ start:708 stop:1001 length:294 start_codon:yes stop_codon:yes gene_type:complete
MKVVVNCRESRWDRDLQRETWNDNFVEFRSGGKTAAYIADQVGAGDRVAIHGQVKGREYNDRFYTDLWLDSIEIQTTNLEDQTDLNQSTYNDDDLPL